jgi:hypothetical protein
MKKLIIPFCIIAFLFITFWITPSCTKDIYEPTKVKDSIVYVTKYDTIKIINNHDTVFTNQDSIHVSFTYTLNYATDSVGTAELVVSTTSNNVPTDATYSWLFDSSGKGFTNPNAPSTATILGYTSIPNGIHMITMILTCPDTKKVYTVAKTFTLNLKN